MDLQMRKDLDKQIDKYKEDLKKNRFTIHSLEKDRDRFHVNHHFQSKFEWTATNVFFFLFRLITQAGEKDTRIMNEMEITKKQDLQLFDYKKQVTTPIIDGR